jgi:hypothetical protein
VQKLKEEMAPGAMPASRESGRTVIWLLLLGVAVPLDICTRLDWCSSMQRSQEATAAVLALYSVTRAQYPESRWEVISSVARTPFAVIVSMPESDGVAA